MRLNIVAGLLTTLFVAGCAIAQSPKPTDEHAGHHPGDAQSGGVATQSAPTATTPPAPDAFDRQMKAMQEMHKKMQAAKTPAERSALMDEHMKLMQSGMAMMEQMMQMMVDRQAAMPSK